MASTIQGPLESKITITWKIDNVASLLESGDLRTSDSFCEGAWRLCAEKHIDDDDDKKETHRGVFLEALFKPEDYDFGTSKLAWIRQTRASVVFKLLDPEGKVSASYRLKDEDLYTSQSPSWGCGNFITPKTVNDAISSDGNITLRAIVTLKDDSAATKKFYQHIGSDLFDDHEVSNVVFAVHWDRTSTKRHVFAIKSVLVKQSEYFETLFESGFSESSSTIRVDPRSLETALTHVFIDEDDMSPFDSAANVLFGDISPTAVEDVAPPPPPTADTSAKRAASETGLDHGDSRNREGVPSKKPRVDEGPEDLGDSEEKEDRRQTFLKVEVPDTPFIAFRGLLAFLHTGQIPFLALPSDWLVARAKAHKEHVGSEDFAFPNRAEWLRANFDDLENLPDFGSIAPSSPHAVFRLADRYGLNDLREHTKRRIIRCLTVENAAYELFSPLSLAFEDLRDEILTYCSNHWDEIKVSEAFKVVLDHVYDGTLPDSRPTLQKLLEQAKAVEPDANEAK